MPEHSTLFMVWSANSKWWTCNARARFRGQCCMDYNSWAMGHTVCDRATRSFPPRANQNHRRWDEFNQHVNENDEWYAKRSDAYEAPFGIGKQWTQSCLSNVAFIDETREMLAGQFPMWNGHQQRDWLSHAAKNTYWCGSGICILLLLCAQFDNNNLFSENSARP